MTHFGPGLKVWAEKRLRAFLTDLPWNFRTHCWLGVYTFDEIRWLLTKSAREEFWSVPGLPF